MIDLQKVCYAYEHEVALRYIDLHIEKGDSLVIQGPNGCGKSTLIKLLNGILFPSEGQLFLQGSRGYGESAEGQTSLPNGSISRWDMCFRMRIRSCFVEV